MDLLYSRKVNRQRWWTRGREGRWGSLEHEGVRGIEVESSVIHACMHACMQGMTPSVLLAATMPRWHGGSGIRSTAAVERVAVLVGRDNQSL